MSDGWAQFELDNPRATKEEIAAVQNSATIFRETFTTDFGKKALELLKRGTTDKPVLDANTTQFGAGIREGQNSIIRQIEGLIKLAEEGL